MQFIKLHRGERGLEGIHFERTCPHHVHLRSGGPEYLISKTISKREAVIIWILSKITGIRESKIRYEKVLRCGPLWPAWNFTSDLGPDGECDPNSDNPCCSPAGFCGFLDEHCKCEGCIDFRITNPSNRKLCYICIHTPILVFSCFLKCSLTPMRTNFPKTLDQLIFSKFY